MGIKTQLEQLLNKQIHSIDKLHESVDTIIYRLTCSRRTFLAKLLPLDKKSRLIAETNGLKHIQKQGVISIPNILAEGPLKEYYCLCTEFILSKKGDKNEMKRFASQLAALHSIEGDHFGLPSSNYIGPLDQINSPSDHWATFYFENRLQSQLQFAIQKNMLYPGELPKETDIQRYCEELLSDVQRPMLIHGDLWSGNFLISTNGEAYLIDPAIYYGDTLVDIAMSQLFGGFGQHFYEQYFSIHKPKKKDAEKIDLYQLYFLLVHLNLFGISYKESVLRIIHSWK